MLTTTALIVATKTDRSIASLKALRKLLNRSSAMLDIPICVPIICCIPIMCRSKAVGMTDSAATVRVMTTTSTPTQAVFNNHL